MPRRVELLCELTATEAAPAICGRRCLPERPPKQTRMITSIATPKENAGIPQEPKYTQRTALAMVVKKHSIAAGYVLVTSFRVGKSSTQFALLKVMRNESEECGFVFEPTPTQSSAVAERARRSVLRHPDTQGKP